MEVPPVRRQSPVANPAEKRLESRRWWIKLVLQPVLFVMGGAGMIAGLGVAQQFGWLSANEDGHNHSHASAGSEGTLYICPMMCTPPQKEPGRCPVCGMELVPTTAGAGQGGSTSIRIDPVARRVADIQTVAVAKRPMTRTLRVVGKLLYDEGNLKTLSAYVDGRLEKLYADYTGVVVHEGDKLALVYSPDLYAGQVEMLLTKKALRDSESSTLRRVALSNRELYESSKRRLIELGMTESQLAEIERTGQAGSRMHLYAPINGTVIQKNAIEGQYVKEGEAIYQLADLSTVWLMLELFPEDAASIRYGQKVSAQLQSLPGREFTGRVAFIDPQVDPKTRTVSVRVVIPNESAQLRVGDYAKATIDVPMVSSPGNPQPIYDPQLANKWISPRHPHVVESSPGQCRICGVDLVPASTLGFTDEPEAKSEALVVPRSAVLMAGNQSVVYVETEPGRFEIRRVTLGPICGEAIAILKGIKAGEQVATKGNFLIDSQMQLAGNPSLIDPTKAIPRERSEPTPIMLAAIEKLPKEDQAQAVRQRICPVTNLQLGTMGTPLKVKVNGTPVFLCCDQCRESLLSEPEKYLAKLKSQKNQEGLESQGEEMSLPPIGSPQPLEPVEGQEAQTDSDSPVPVKRVAGKPEEGRQ